MTVGGVDFLYIGMSKSGSTYLYQLCCEHPDIFVPIIKDIYFFDQEFERGADWYFSYFSGVRPGQKVGEISHDYLFSQEACERIHQILPDVTILICVREPIDWLLSRYMFDLGRRNLAGVSLIDFAREDINGKETRIGSNLRMYRQLFAKENIHVLFFD